GSKCLHVGVTWLSEERRVLAYKVLPFGGHVGLKKNRGHRASRLARSAVNAGRGIYVHLLLIWATLNAVNRANINTRQFFGADARLTYPVGQDVLRRNRVICCSSPRSFG